MAAPDEPVAAAGPPGPATVAAGADEQRGLEAMLIDPFAGILAFAKARKSGQVKTAFASFLARWKEPIDVRADKVLDLAAFGKGPHLFLKMPRQKKPEEFSGDLSDRMKTDLERQFNLRNLARYVKTVDRGDPLEFERKAVEVGKLDRDSRSHIQEFYKKIEGITLVLGADQVRAEQAWRHKMLEVMQWERYFSKEIKDDFSGPLWRHDPDTNPIGAQGRQTGDKTGEVAVAAVPGAEPAGAVAPGAEPAGSVAPVGDAGAGERANVTAAEAEVGEGEP